MAGQARDHRLDFFRGAALFFIFVDHIPDNMASYLTLHSVAFSDAAEVFIFISGYTAALVYARAMAREGWLMASARIMRRVWQLYVAHLCLFMIYNAEVAYTVRRFNNPLFIEELNAGAFLDDPAATVVRVLLLQFQPNFLDILPLYIALLATFPLVLLAMRRHLLLALIPSVLLYAAVRIWGLNMPGYPDGRTWVFDPFAWQLLFVIGAAFGLSGARGAVLVKPRPWLLPAAFVACAAGLVIQGSWILNDLFDTPMVLHRALWPVEKTTLSPLRIANMLALAFVAAKLIPVDAGFLRRRPAWLVVLCGQNSLEMFCLSILLSLMGNAIFSVAGTTPLVQIGVNGGGIAVLLGFGLLLAWFDGGGRLPRPAPRPGHREDA